MERGQSSNRVLSKFFKVYIPGESGDDLEIPTSFNSSLPKSLPRTVTVRSIHGKNWKMVFVRKCDGEVERFALVNGWKRIVEDEGLNERDFLAFEFDGSRCFHFCVYDGTTMCKRLGSSSMETDEIKSESDGHDGVIDLSDSNSDTDDDDEDNDDDDDYTKYLDDRTNPSFKMNLNPKKKSQLRIPTFVIQDYNLNFPESVKFVDPLVQKYGPLERKIKTQGNGSVFVRKFGSIIRRNQVKPTDTMLFELKKTGNNLVHTIKVYIING